MKACFKTLVAALFFSLVSVAGANAETGDERYVRDYLGVLSGEEISSLEERFNSLYRSALVTVISKEVAVSDGVVTNFFSNPYRKGFAGKVSIKVDENFRVELDVIGRPKLLRMVENIFSDYQPTKDNFLEKTQLLVLKLSQKRVVLLDEKYGN